MGTEIGGEDRHGGLSLRLREDGDWIFTFWNRAETKCSLSLTH